MLDKSELLRQMRKHAKTFSSAISPKKEVDQKSINHALALIDLFAKDTNYGSYRKSSLKVPTFLKDLRINKNLNLLESKTDKKIPLGLSVDTHKNKMCRKEKDKFKQAEKTLLKLLSTKNC